MRLAEMKQKLAELSQRYLLSLRKHLKHVSHASLLAASRLGSEAAALGLGVRGLTRIHKRALTLLEPLSRKKRKIKGGESFLTLAAAPFGKSHRAAGGNRIALNRLNAPMSRHMAVENGRPQSGKDKSKCLGEALQLQKRLRQMTHRALAAQEDERKKISCELQDEIAQTLLGINVRLLSLKEKARNSPTGLKKEIASTQRLVVKSAKFMRRFARELDIHR
jgi:signal transduction histidine kinase